jgi:predicted phage terminase large subunit-like protein
MVTATIEAGNVYLPAISTDPERVEPWVAEFVDEHSKFRGDDSGHDDQVDACTQALARLNKPLLIAETSRN